MNDLLDLKDLELPEENLSMEQKEKIKSNINRTIKKYKESCYKTVDIENIKVPKEILLSPRNKVVVNGISNTATLQYIVTSSLDKSTVYEGELLYKRVFKAGANTSIEAGGINGMAFNLLSGTTCYVYVFITTKQIVMHNLDNYFRVIESKTYNLKDIIYFKGYVESRSMCIVANGEVGKDTIILCRWYDFKKGEIDKVCMILKKLGIKDASKEKTMAQQLNKGVNKVSLVTTTIAVALVLYMIIRLFILK